MAARDRGVATTTRAVFASAGEGAGSKVDIPDAQLASSSWIKE
jgi:hypothetical protein